MQLRVLPLTCARLFFERVGIKGERGTREAGWGSAAGKTGLKQPRALWSMFEGSLTKVILTLSVSLARSLPCPVLPVVVPVVHYSSFFTLGLYLFLVPLKLYIKSASSELLPHKGKERQGKKKKKRGKKVLVFSSCELLLTLSAVPITQ